MGVGTGVAAGAGSGAAAGSMFGPWGTAIGAGLGGLTGFLGAQKQEEEARKQARRELTNRFLGGGSMMQLTKPVEKADMAAEVGQPLFSAGIQALGEIGKKPKPGEEAPTWYEQAAKGYLGAVK